jgi:hypothetical protein
VEHLGYDLHWLCFDVDPDPVVDQHQNGNSDTDRHQNNAAQQHWYFSF